MKHALYIFIGLIFWSVSIQGQHVNLIRDSLVDHYLSSGKGNSLFVSEGKYDKHMRKTGPWKAYSVDEDFVYISTPEKPEAVQGSFLKYGEGRFVRGNPHGSWKYYVIEDRTFRKILMREISYVHGVPQGKVTHYYTSGSKSVEYNFKDAEPHGVVNTYYESGGVYSACSYTEGIRAGTHYYYRTNGDLKLEMQYEADSLDGFLRSYYPDGKLQESLSYVNGKAHGMYQYYHANGRLWIEKEYKDGKLWNISGSYDPEGNPRDKGTIVNGNGTAKYYNQEGVLYAIQTLKEGILVDEQNFDVPANFRE